MTVSVVRGNDGFGFTICSDCPVRVQAVDAGGPAHRSGLLQGDSILQLNGVPVETWKCADLAHAIRSCPSQIVLVVWRGLPEPGSDADAWLRPLEDKRATSRKLLSHPAHSKHGRRWSPGGGAWAGLGGLGSLWGDRREEPEEDPAEQEEDFSAQAATLKGTRVTASNGDNYLILSPVHPGGQVLPPVYGGGNGTIGRLYQTHPSRGQHLVHDTLPTASRRPLPGRTSTLPTAASVPPGNLNNYQNCTMVQSHLACSYGTYGTYGTYAPPAPKTLIFPVFVQPLDLCSPDRTLLMSEEMVLHQSDLLPAKVTVLIYSDLLLLTREEESGRCNVLQSPLYLNTLQLREVPSQPLHLYLLHGSACGWRCLLSLEASSFQQKVRVSLCLHDNIKLQLVTMEMAYSPQVPDPPSDLGPPAVGQSDLLCAPPSRGSPAPPSSSPPPPPPPPPPPASSSVRSPVWKEREQEEQEEQEEERQQGEGESASETSESSGRLGGRGFPLGSTHFCMNDEESDGEELSVRPAVLRRSLSDGSLLQEPRSPRFYSDSTIHRLTRPPTPDRDALNPDRDPPRLPSLHLLRKQLSKEGGTLQQMLLLLNGTKGPESGTHQMRKKTRTLAADVRTRLAFLRRRKCGASFHGNSLEKALRNHRPSPDEVLKWAEGLEVLLLNPYGVAVFRHFLRSEFSEENLDFWLAVERFRRTRPLSKMAALGENIYEEFISTTAARQVNVDSSVRESTNQSLRRGLSPASFQLAQQQVFSLMETDSYPRFLKSRLFAQLANHQARQDRGAANQEG
ncbi:regulator of G-protein signaling 3-like isoform X2 [Salarias fasciatus]|uniref:regulator of G-protein signaling 3-like isoform X2 n=1 Tax=Salarias fasciatus TaxID=181472 RepID=UPI001176C195|nr:regulator of G-protein signaling 3-like isoform X2 [Salarias fasciatus]